MKPFSFRLMVETDEQTGDVIAVYFQFRKGKVAQTKEFADGAAFANYGKKGELLGVELLAPCTVSVLDQISEQKEVRKFMRRSAPKPNAWASSIAAAPC